MRASRHASRVLAAGSVALVGLTAIGCSADAANPAPLTAKSASAATAPTAMLTSSTATGLAAKLLAPADLRGAWRVDTAATNAPMSVNCPLLNDAAWNAPLPQRAEGNLSEGLSGPYLVEELAAGTSDEADKAWQLLTAGLPNCTTYTHSGSLGQSTFTIARTKLPRYGDASYAFTLSITISGGVNASGDIVAARSGNSVAVLYIVGLNDVSSADVEDAVAKAAAKART